MCAPSCCPHHAGFMELLVHTRRMVRDINPTRTHAIISVRTPGDDPLVFRPNPLLRGVLHLAFADLEFHPTKSIPIPLLRQLAELQGEGDVVMFDPSMAEAILDFWQTHRDVEELHIHCDAGYCRSPAIAAVLARIAIGDDVSWFATKRPNRLVYDLLLEAARRRGLLPAEA